MKANKNEIVEKIATLGNVTKGEAEEMYNLVVDSLEEIVIGELKGITLGKLGSFRLQTSPAREFKHPNDPTKSTIKPERQRLTFRANKTTQKDIEERTAK